MDTKNWYQSKTVWGALIAMAAPMISHFGMTLRADDQAALADLITTLIGTSGGLLAIYGRLTATKSIGV